MGLSSSWYTDYSWIIDDSLIFGCIFVLWSVLYISLALLEAYIVYSDYLINLGQLDMVYVAIEPIISDQLAFDSLRLYFIGPVWVKNALPVYICYIAIGSKVLDI